MHPTGVASIENPSRDVQTEVNTDGMRGWRFSCVLTTFVFVRRYAYHLRRWALEGQGISSHVISWELGAIPLHIVVHAAGTADKITLEMASNDYIADLRAEVAKWWEAMTIKRCQTAVSNFFAALHDVIRLVHFCAFVGRKREECGSETSHASGRPAANDHSRTGIVDRIRRKNPGRNGFQRYASRCSRGELGSAASSWVLIGSEIRIVDCLCIGWRESIEEERRWYGDAFVVATSTAGTYSDVIIAAAGVLRNAFQTHAHVEYDSRKNWG